MLAVFKLFIARLIFRTYYIKGMVSFYNFKLGILVACTEKGNKLCEKSMEQVSLLSDQMIHKSFKA